MRTIPLLTFSDLENTRFTGFFKFIILTINQFENSRKFILLGPCAEHVYHRQIILSFLEEKKLTNSNVRVTIFGGGLFFLCNPIIIAGMDLNKVIDRAFDRERPIMIFSGKSMMFGPTSKDHIVECLQDGGLLQTNFLPVMSLDNGILLTREKDIKKKTYSVKALREIED